MPFLGAKIGYKVIYDGSLPVGSGTPSSGVYGLYILVEKSTRGGCALITFSLSNRVVMSDPLNIVDDYYTLSQGSSSGSLIVTNKDSVPHETKLIKIGY